MSFKIWLKKLEEMLQDRFGLGVDDIYGVEKLKQDYQRGETPKQVADFVKEKWELIE